MTDESDLSWMDAEDPNEVVQSILLDTASPPNRNAVPIDGLPDGHRRVALALKALSWRQRIWMRAFLEGGCTKRGAKRVLEDQLYPVPDDSSITRWHHTEKYATALTLLKAHYVKMIGMDSDSILLKTNLVLDDALEPKPILHMGEDTGFREINGNVAMRAIEFAGKVNKMINPDGQGPRVTLVVNIANRDDLETVNPL